MGQGRVQDSLHVHAQNAAIIGRQRLGKTIHGTRMPAKACRPAQTANHVPE